MALLSGVANYVDHGHSKLSGPERLCFEQDSRKADNSIIVGQPSSFDIDENNLAWERSFGGGTLISPRSCKTCSKIVGGSLGGGTLISSRSL
jgi:hypothetical protein